MHTIKKAVFPVAGLGTRFLPATKASPKEMLPIVDKPLIQYATDEAVATGIDTLVFVTGKNKRSIEDHFDDANDLEYELERKGSTELLNDVQNILPAAVHCVYIRQPKMNGLGDAVLRAKPAIGNSPFAVILADDLINNETDAALAQMIKLYEEHRCNIICVEQVPKSDVDKYGIVELNDFNFITNIVEKPNVEDANSDIAIIGRYIFTPSIFQILKNLKRTEGEELQLTDAINVLLYYEKVLVYQFDGKRYDCGSKLGYLQANVEYALRHKEIGDTFQAYLETLYNNKK